MAQSMKLPVLFLLATCMASQAFAFGPGQPVSGNSSPQSPVSPCEVVRFGSPLQGLCGGVTPPPPPPPGDTNQDLTLVNQGLGKDPLSGGGNNGGNLLGEGGNLPINNVNFPGGDLGNLAPAAGGNAQGNTVSAEDEGITCMNAYLQNGWSNPAMKKKCSGGDDASEI